AWIERQNAYTDAVLGTRPEPALFAPRLEQLLSTDQVEQPVHRSGRYFFERRAVGQDLFSIYMRERIDGPDQLLIDPAPLSRDQTTSVDILSVSRDGSTLAYLVRRGGADEIEVRFFDVNARRDTGTPLATARYYNISVAPDNSTVYFTRATPDGPRVMRRAIAGGEETKLFGDRYTREKIILTDLSGDGRHLLIQVLYGSAPKQVDIFIDDTADAAPPRTVTDDLEARSFAYFAGEHLVIGTNWNAPNDRVMLAPIAAPQRANWKELVPENPKQAMQAVSVAGGRVFVLFLENVRPRLLGYDLTGRQTDEMQFEILGDLGELSGEWDSPVSFVKFSSFHVPPTIYEYNVPSRERRVFARQGAPVNPDDFVVEQVWYPSKDGTRVPMFVMYRKGLQRNGANRTYLTGYGGFTSSLLPAFSQRAIAWAEQGGVYAVANLRGGAEFGEEWHQAGMLGRKQNTFDDFIAAAEFLIRERYTTASRLGIAGGSNGGLLVMAAAMQRPELFGAVVCRYPLIDMLRYHKFLVGSFWVPEYGDPEKPEEFRWLHAYSPYHHVRKGEKYPATLFITGDADTRVAPLHARKMTALMQAANGSDEPILLRYHIAAGHSGGQPMRVQARNTAEELGFLWWQLGDERAGR
ncbi:MAG TPA: prolyl oligopeptidase family serine peptidase, partial [Thermoanaerobaculia bacterium]|nr:prolyl oligopeptidase family serine peptidase [Thermoanaerobaculia bacterium]